MTREEAIAYGESKNARIQEKLHRAGSSYGDYAIYYSEMAFTSAALAALREQEERRWIPVTERLPDKEFWEHNKLYENEDLEVLVIIKGAKMATTLLYNAEGEFYSMDADGETFYVVTHWMPMPEPPKEENKDA